MKKKKVYKKKRSYFYETYDPYSEDGLSKSNSINNMPINRHPSKMELEISKFLDILGIFYIQEYFTKDLKSPLTGNKLYIDFYLPTYKLAIEYDGEHHFKNKDAIKLKEQQIRDAAKNKWCKHHGIKMIRFNKNNKEEFANTILKTLKY